MVGELQAWRRQKYIARVLSIKSSCVLAGTPHVGLAHNGVMTLRKAGRYAGASGRCPPRRSRT